MTIAWPAAAAGDVLFGGDGADRLAGGDGADLLSGGAGDDILEGGASDDRLSGGSGRRQLRVPRRLGADRITDFAAGEDWIDLVGITLEQVEVVDTPAVDTPAGVHTPASALLTVAPICWWSRASVPPTC